MRVRLALILMALTATAAAAPATPGPAAKDLFLKPVLLDPHGRAVRLADYKGKVRVFEVWASWCGPCRMEIPELNAIYERYRAKGLVVVGISVDDEPADVLDFVQQIPIRYPYGMMNPEAAAVLGIGNGQMAIPITLVVDRTGRLRKRFVGLMRPDFLEREIAGLL